MKAISSAVGRQALNAEVDQTTVRDLLNKVAPSDGGPMSRLSAPPRDRVVSAALQAAIEKFQNANVDPPFRDGRVDPGGQTLRMLNALAGEGPVKPHPGYDPHLGGVIEQSISVDVSAGLVGLKQPTTDTCWATAATMMWKLKNPGQIPHGLPAADQITTFLGTKTRNRLWLDLFNKNSALNAQLFQEFFGRELGMRTLDGLLPALFSGNAGGAHFWLPRLYSTRKPHLVNSTRLGLMVKNFGMSHTSLIVRASLADHIDNSFAPKDAPGLGVVTLLDPTYGRYHNISGADIDYLLGPPGAGTVIPAPPVTSNRLRCFFWP